MSTCTQQSQFRAVDVRIAHNARSDQAGDDDARTCHTWRSTIVTENSFDTITKLFASRRLIRRQAVKGAAGITATGLAVMGLSDRSKAQEASPVPDETC